MRTLFISLWLFCHSIVGFAAETTGASHHSVALEQVRTFIENQDYDQLGHVLRASIGTIDLQLFERVALQENCTPLYRAIQATQAIDQMNAELGINSAEIAEMCLFIETKLQDYIDREQYYIATKESALPRAIEYDPETKMTFIHLGVNGIDRVGKGSRKLVTKSIQYNTQKPEILACCTQTKNPIREMKITRLMQGSKGIVDAKAFTTHLEEDIRYYTVMCKLYTPGPLARALKDRSCKFTTKEKVKIALDIAKGLESLEEKNIIHKDFCADNCLLNVIKKKNGQREVEAVVADLGSANFVDQASGCKPQGHSAYTPPEGIFREKLSGRDYFKSDLFAAGTLFCRLLYEQKPTWLDAMLIKGPKPALQRYKKHVALIEKSTKKKRAKLYRKAQGARHISPREEFELVVLQMVNPDPNKRGSAAQVRMKLEKIYNRMK